MEERLDHAAANIGVNFSVRLMYLYWQLGVFDHCPRSAHKL
jgi:hypothetical protein